MAKQLIFGNESREKILAGVSKLAAAVRIAIKYDEANEYFDNAL